MITMTIEITDTGGAIKFQGTITDSEDVTRAERIAAEQVCAYLRAPMTISVKTGEVTSQLANN